MSKENDMKERGAAPVVLDGNRLRDEAIRSLQGGTVVAALVINNMDGVHVGRAGYAVEIMPGCDYIVFAVPRAWPEIGERIAVLPIAPPSPSDAGQGGSEHGLHTKSEPN